MIFKCNECGETRKLQKATVVLRDGQWITKEALCTCGDTTYMEQVLTSEYKGLPKIKLNDSGQKL